MITDSLRPFILSNTCAMVIFLTCPTWWEWSPETKLIVYTKSRPSSVCLNPGSDLKLGSSRKQEDDLWSPFLILNKPSYSSASNRGNNNSELLTNFKCYLETMLCRADSKYLLSTVWSTVGCDIPNVSRDSSYCEIVTELHFFRSTQGVHTPLMKATIMHTSCNPVQSRDWLSSCQKLTSTVIFLNLQFYFVSLIFMCLIIWTIYLSQN